MKVVKKKPNPFELKYNRKKFEIVGKNDSLLVAEGKPSQSHSISEQKRVEVLKKKLKMEKKKNVFKDGRFGEHSNQLSAEEKMMQRFMVEKQKKFYGQKSQTFSLSDDDDDFFQLTHAGKALGGDNLFHDTRLEEEEEEFNLTSRQTADLHFGGGEKEKKNYKQILEEIIQKSKFHKMNRKREREENEVLIESLNQEFNEIEGLLSKTPQMNPKQTADHDLQYDDMVQLLKMDKRARPTDRLKTKEELELEQAKKLQEMEASRLKRMTGASDSESEEEEDGDDEEEVYSDMEEMKFEYGKKKQKKESEGEALVYKDGVLQNPESFFMKKKKDSDTEEDDDNNDDDEVETESEEEVGSDIENGDAEAEDDFILDDENNDDSNNEDEETVEELSEQSEEESEEEETETKEIIEEVAELKDGLPFVISVPESAEELNQLLDQYQLEQWGKVLERIYLSNHPQLSPQNKKKMQNFVPVFLSFLFDQPQLNFQQLFKTAMKTLLTLSFQFSEPFSQFCLDYLRRLSNAEFFTQQNLSFFMFWVKVFSRSDFSHPILTPFSLMLAKQLETLTRKLCASFIKNQKKSSNWQQERFKILRIMLKGLFLSHLIIELSHESKRFWPEVLNFWNVCLMFFDPQHLFKTEFPDFISLFTEKLDANEPLFELSEEPKESKTSFSLLFDSSEELEANMIWKMTLDSFFHYIGHQLKIQASNLALPLHCFVERPKFDDYPTELFIEPLLDHLNRVPLESSKKYSQTLESQLNQLFTIRKQYSINQQQRPPLQWQKQKVQQISTKAPSAQNFHQQSSDSETTKLKKMVQREKKSLMRDMKKEGKTLSEMKLKKQKEQDQFYSEKIRKIYGTLSQEQAEKKQLIRERKRRK